MLVSAATRPAPNTVNEDFFCIGPHYAAVLDGCTDPGRDSGCVHNVSWLAARVSGHLAAVLSHDHQTGLPQLVGEAIARTRADHRDTCDLSNPDSPSTTVTVLRERGDMVDYLLLGDSPLLIEHHDGGIEFLCDDQVDHLTSYTFDAVARARNTPGGFWVASTDPDAPTHGVHGSFPRHAVRSALLMSDGLSRLGERYGYSWREVLDLVKSHGPAATIDTVHDRDAQRETPAVPVGRTTSGKRFDDATAAWCHIENF